MLMQLLQVYFAFDWGFGSIRVGQTVGGLEVRGFGGFAEYDFSGPK